MEVEKWEEELEYSDVKQEEPVADEEDEEEVEETEEEEINWDEEDLG